MFYEEVAYEPKYVHDPFVKTKNSELQNSSWILLLFIIYLIIIIFMEITNRLFTSCDRENHFFNFYT